MNNLVCIKHPLYKGTVAPDLTCKSCCKIFVAVLENTVKPKETPTNP
jgi:hypothetical protein